MIEDSRSEYYLTKSNSKHIVGRITKKITILKSPGTVFNLRVMATGTVNQDAHQTSENEPLLGRAQGTTQKEENSLYSNLILGTAIIAQVGIVFLTVVIWAAILIQDLTLFSAHPLLNSAGILALTESIIILQPTHTPDQKRSGTVVHAVLNAVTSITLIAGLVVIEYNKFAHNGMHFKSIHAIIGFITYMLIIIQVVIGFTQYYTPSLYGSVANAKAIYKYHRMSGYLLLLLMLITIATATQTTFNINSLNIRLWAVLVTSALVLIGVIPRIKLRKLGITQNRVTDTNR
ncbi:hypothetical protein K3495_g11432 [Podosphaera aphanis]|nr:hypothetical protein K3495_g11432 [Podosphaera aphanis]